MGTSSIPEIKEETLASADFACSNFIRGRTNPRARFSGCSLRLHLILIKNLLE